MAFASSWKTRQVTRWPAEWSLELAKQSRRACRNNGSRSGQAPPGYRIPSLRHEGSNRRPFSARLIRKLPVLNPAGRRFSPLRSGTGTTEAPRSSPRCDPAPSSGRRSSRTGAGSPTEHQGIESGGAATVLQLIKYLPAMEVTQRLMLSGCCRRLSIEITGGEPLRISGGVGRRAALLLRTLE